MTPRPQPPRVEAKLYRYMGMVVRLLRGEVRSVLIHGQPVAAGHGKYPRATKSFAPLPKRLRAKVRSDLDDAARRERLKTTGIEVAEAGVVYHEVAVPKR